MQNYVGNIAWYILNSNNKRVTGYKSMESEWKAIFGYFQIIFSPLIELYN